ncbi:endomembrane protein 70-domain containing protein [Nitzschia inconspicua]|uniref:Transmembrane 9 superfamily member n=1 Tax=Nitzschia inconspicua TaxID=303405 RepID=A0A9K3LR09_9STRA|nr:endomembrane protein 70-domain containing protein [Nitzschia inconspicua]
MSRFLSAAGCLLVLLVHTSNAANQIIENPEHKVKTRREKKKSAVLAHAHHSTSTRGSLAQHGQVKDKTMLKLENHKRLNRREKKEVARAEMATYKDMRRQGVDEISNTREAALLRNYRLRNKKKIGLLRKKEASLAQVLFPGVSPEEYMNGERVWIYADLVESKKTQVPYEYYDLPGCPLPLETEGLKRKRMRKNLGARLQGHDMKPAPFDLYTLKDKPCTPMCLVRLEGKKLRWMRKMIERQYRVQLQLDSLPVLMRSKEMNYAVRGYPIGFRAPIPANDRRRPKEQKPDIYLYNHLKFAITYHEDPQQFDGIRITGFDVHPVSISHDIPETGPVTPNTQLSTCVGFNVENDPKTFLNLSFEQGNSISVIYSYDIQWIQNELEWADRWDVYLVGAPDDEIHYYSIVNSLMIVLFMTGAIATIMIRTLRKDIAGYNELQTLEEAQEETGWKLVHGDVFRPPQSYPMLLSVMVGTGAQIGSAFVFALLLAIFKITNSMKKGQMLTSIILLYVLCGSIAGFISARIYKYCEAKNWKLNSIVTATALPGVFVCMFSILNVFLSMAGAATAVSFWTILALFLMWVCISAPLVFVGAFVGLKASSIDTPTKTNQIARFIPDAPWHMNAIVTMFMGGILPFGSVCIELAFIMSALWLHQIYYVMGFLLAVVAILAATCAQVSIVLCYLQLCAEDHRWWWKSFWNCAMAGFYLFMYSLWFLSSRLDLVGFLPVVVYLTYMSMISVCFGLFCGSVGFLSSFWFTRTIYGAVKVD